jgi:formylglycine-generating enzyme required for sulfatase activity
VGLKKPNDFGLFDVQGNCFVWCQEPQEPYPLAKGDKAVEDKEVDNLVIDHTRTHVLRGGSYSTLSPSLRSANRDNYIPTNRGHNYGFRLARTIRPVTRPADVSAGERGGR